MEVKSEKPRLVSQASPLVINEHLANPPAEIAGDANGDGTRDPTQDEFVEVVNAGPAPLDVSGFTISDAVTKRFTFPLNTIIPAGEAAVVFGGGSPRGDFGNAAANHLVFAAGGAGLALNNGGDSIIIRDNNGVEITRRDYPAADGSAGPSITRSPDITGGFVKHSLATGSGGRLFSPGARVNGRAFASIDPLINSITPSAVVVGGGDVTALVEGSAFQSGATARIDGTPLITTFISATILSADIPASIIERPGAHAVTVENPDMSISNPVDFVVLGAIGVNEFLADPPDTIAGDANGDGTRDSSQDEFVEIANRTDSPVDVGGFTISDATQLRFTFPPNTTIPAGEVAVIFGGGSPRGDFGNAATNGLVFAASLSLNNTGDTITLKDNASAIIDSITFGSAEGNANQSLNRNPDFTGASFALHSTIADSGGKLFSPGTRASGMTFTTGPRISQIAPDRAPFENSPLKIFIQGSGFEAGSRALIDSEFVPAEFLSASELSVIVPASVRVIVGNHSIRARNAGGNRSNAVALFIIPPAPILRAIAPEFAQVGSGSFTLLASGERFDSSSIVLIDDLAIGTQFISARQLKATVPAAVSSSPGSRRVRVRNADGQQSSERLLRVVPPLPRIDSLTPFQVVVGGPVFTLKVAGANFKSDAVVNFDQTPLATTFISSAMLRAEVPASLITDTGPRAVTVQNSDGAISEEAALRVVAAQPLIYSIEPPSVIEGSGDVMVEIAGENFQPGAVAQIVDDLRVGPQLVTRFVTSGKLETNLPAALNQAAGGILLRVQNPDFGISNRVAFNITIKDPLVINEFLADPPDTIAGDANGDGSRNSAQDEFVEIVNRTPEPIDLSGYKLSDADAARHVFLPGTIVPAFEAVVVFGGGTATGAFGNAAANKLVFKASSGALSLNNDGDTIKLQDATGRVVQEIKFGAAEGNANQSINRDPDAQGASFSPHTKVAASGRLFSPGAKATGEPFTIKPRIRALAPANARAGSPALTLTIAGENFLPGAAAVFGSVILETRYRSEAELEASLSAAFIFEGGAVEVRARNPRGEMSEAVKFLVIDDPPRIASINPQKTGTGAEKFQITVSGERFQRGAVVSVAGSPVETAFVDQRSLVAVVPDRFFVRAAALELRVLNADGNQSNAVKFAVDNGPLITRLDRSRIKAGARAVEMIIGGLAFKPGVALFVNDAAVATSFLNEAALAARIPAELTGNPGALTLQARNPDGGRSNKVTIKVVE